MMLVDPASDSSRIGSKQEAQRGNDFSRLLKNLHRAVTWFGESDS